MEFSTGQLLHGEHGDFMVFEVRSDNKKIFRVRVDTWIAIAGAAGLTALFLLLYFYKPGLQQKVIPPAIPAIQTEAKTDGGKVD